MYSTIKLDFLAPIPVGNKIQLDYYESEGVFSSKVKPDIDHPVITDLTSGIRYAYGASGDMFHRLFISGDPIGQPRVVKQDFAIVKSTTILSRHDCNSTEINTVFELELL